MQDPTPPTITSGLLVSSAPLGWPDITVEQRYIPGPGRIEKRGNAEGPQIMVWHEGVEIEVTIDGQDHSLHQPSGGMIVLPAASTMTARPVAASRFIRLQLSARHMDALAAELLGRPYRILPFSGPPDFAFAAIARLLVDAATGRTPLDAEMVAGTVREIAVHLLHAYSDQTFARKDAAGKLAPAALVRVLNLIGDHLHEPLPVERLAREAGVSRSHFTRAFTRSLGRPPHAYVMSRRVAKAAHLLHHSALAIEQIAAACGFYDQAHMSRQFRVWMQTTPRAYRRTAGPDRG